MKSPVRDPFHSDHFGKKQFHKQSCFDPTEFLFHRAMVLLYMLTQWIGFATQWYRPSFISLITRVYLLKLVNKSALGKVCQYASCWLSQVTNQTDTIYLKSNHGYRPRFYTA